MNELLEYNPFQQASWILGTLELRLLEIVIHLWTLSE